MQSFENSHVIRGGHHQHQHMHSKQSNGVLRGEGRDEEAHTRTYNCINKYLVVSALTRLLKWAMGQSESKCLQTLTEYGLCGFTDSFPPLFPLADDDYGQKTVSVLVDNIETDLEVIDHPACEMSVSINRQYKPNSQTYVCTIYACLGLPNSGRE